MENGLLIKQRKPEDNRMTLKVLKGKATNLEFLSSKNTLQKNEGKVQTFLDRQTLRDLVGSTSSPQC